MFSGIEILQKGSEWKRVISNSYAKYVRYNLIQHTWVFKATSCLLDQWKWKPKADHLYGLFELLFVLPCLFPLSCYVYIWIRLLTSVHNKCERCVLRDMYLLKKNTITSVLSLLVSNVNVPRLSIQHTFVCWKNLRIRGKLFRVNVFFFYKFSLLKTL